MPEPVALAIAVACASLISGVVTLSKQITSFVSDVRASRTDMDAVSRELSSLTLCVQALRDDSSKKDPLPRRCSAEPGWRLAEL